jgi:DNA modification methylase
MTARLLLPAPGQTSLGRLDSVSCCDALTYLRSLPDGYCDAVITDPPYGLAGRVFDVPHKHYSAINEAWDTFAPVSWMAECKRVLKPSGSVICFGVRQSIYAFAGEGLRLGWKLINDITWVKPDAPPCFTGRLLTESTERILWFCPDGEKWVYNLAAAKSMNTGINLRDVWYFKIERDDRVHPAQKPIELLERIVELFTPPDAVICDPFAGSGTTLDAARRLGRHYIGCDLNSDYVALARKRLDAPYTMPMMPMIA